MSAEQLIEDVARDTVRLETAEARRMRLEVEQEDRRAKRVDVNPMKSVWDGVDYGD